MVQKGRNVHLLVHENHLCLLQADCKTNDSSFHDAEHDDLSLVVLVQTGVNGSSDQSPHNQPNGQEVHGGEAPFEAIDEIAELLLPFSVKKEEEATSEHEHRVEQQCCPSEEDLIRKFEREEQKTLPQEQVGEVSNVGLNQCLYEGTSPEEVPPQVYTDLEIEQAKENFVEDENDDKSGYCCEQDEREYSSHEVIIYTVNFHVLLI